MIEDEKSLSRRRTYMTDQTTVTEAPKNKKTPKEKKPKAVLKNPNAAQLILGYPDVGEHIAKIHHMRQHKGFLIPFSLLSACLGVQSYKSVRKNLLAYDHPATKASKNGAPSKAERKMMAKWKLDNPALVSEMEERDITPREWLAQYGIFNQAGYADVSALDDPAAYKAKTGLDMSKYLRWDFPKAMGVADDKAKKFIFRRIVPADFCSEKKYPTGKEGKKFNFVYLNKELGIKIPQGESKAEKAKAPKIFGQLVFQQIMIRRMDMILAGGVGSANIKRALYWLPKKTAEIKREIENKRKEKKIQLAIVHGDNMRIAELYKNLSTLYRNIINSENDLKMIADIEYRLKRGGYRLPGKDFEIFKSKSEIPTASFRHKEIGYFWSEHIVNGYSMMVDKIETVRELLLLLDQEGDITSVVDELDRKIIKKIDDKPTSYDLVMQVPLWSHSLNVAKQMIARPHRYQPSLADKVLEIDYIIIGLAHDLGKLPSIRPASYITKDHTMFVELALDRCKSINKLPGFYISCVDAIKYHHGVLPAVMDPSADNYVNRLRKADIEARRVEMSNVITSQLGRDGR
jgi:hypothetical protein